MKRAEMVCAKCIKCDQDTTWCQLDPKPMSFEATSLDPTTHWCSKGMWHQWSERYREMEPFYWGEWEN